MTDMSDIASFELCISQFQTQTILYFFLCESRIRAHIPRTVSVAVAKDHKYCMECHHGILSHSVQVFMKIFMGRCSVPAYTTYETLQRVCHHNHKLCPP